MALTVTQATTNAHLNSIATLFNLKVSGVSIVDELNADWGASIPMTLAFWQPIMADPACRILMASAGATLRGAGLWRFEDGVWIVKIIGVDKRLTAQQREDGLHDFFQSEVQQHPLTTKYGGLAIIGSRIDNYLSPRLSPSARTVLDSTHVQYRTTGTEVLAVL